MQCAYAPDDKTIRVYQAYSDAIADSAPGHGTLVAPAFKIERMTWMKPSFLWMMYRAGWGYKDEDQTRIRVIDITRDGFEWALAHSCPSHPDPGMSREEWEQLNRRSLLAHSVGPGTRSTPATARPSRHPGRPQRGGRPAVYGGMDSADH